MPHGNGSLDFRILTTDLFRLVPTVLMPLSVLSYASVLGILSTLFLVGVMFYDGLSKYDSPGSLWNPARTSLTFESLGQLGLSYGLFMAGVRIGRRMYSDHF